ncbi:hypothetical protein WJ63_16065 [Burkholderia pyrrocinia]|nr:hypothetical protein WJ63_16065 [Burkholderia pyrrocinia]
MPFATNGTKNAIPEASQIGITPGAASLNDGFPPLTFTPITAGGIPPAGADFNGVLNLITQSIRWAHAGGRYAFSSTFSADANVGGYPAGAVLMSADQQGSWLSLNDNNTDNPDTGAGTKWVPSHAYGITAVTGLASSNVTLTPAQAMKAKITLAGTLTANVQIIFPTWTRDWTVVNNTTGAFTVTAKTASGTGIVLAAGQQRITGDGTNIVQPAESIAAATQSQHAMQFGQATGRLLNVQRFVSSGTYTPTAGTNSIIVKLQGGGGGSGGAVGTGASTVSAGGPGTQGAYVESRITSGFSGQAVTVGAAGAAGAAGSGSGGNGGASTFMTLSAGGGFGGGITGASSTSVVAGPSGIAAASGGNIKNLNGLGCGFSQAFASGAAGIALPGMGGGGTTPANAAQTYGCGGGGTTNGFSQSAIVGYAGSQGYVEIWEYA